MKLLIYSDLHLEFAHFDVPLDGYDAVVLAGDIGLGTQGVEWALENFKDVPVLYVFGNHEYYRHEIDSAMNRARETAAGSNVRVMENESSVIGDVEFLGATLWTDFELNGKSEDNKQLAEHWMNDYRQIDYGRQCLRPSDTQRFHFESRDFLDRMLSLETEAEKRIVITHHAPCAKSLIGRRIGGTLSFAYASSLDSLVERSGAALWIHGHTHESVDYRIGETRVISNPRGYARRTNDAENPEFIPDCIVDV